MLNLGRNLFADSRYRTRWMAGWLADWSVGSGWTLRLWVVPDGLDDADGQGGDAMAPMFHVLIEAN